MRNLFASIIITLLIAPSAFGGHSTIPAPKYGVIKSAVLPGWGEHSYNSDKRGYIFNGVEVALWVFAGISSSTANGHENDLFYFASEYGQVTDPHLKSDVFIDRISKYDSMDEYNDQMLRNRQWDQVYSAENGQYWLWESPEKRVEYFDIKTQRYLWRQRLTYSFGAIALNHLVSMMDVLYLKRTQASIQLLPELGSNSAGLRLNLSF